MAGKGCNSTRRVGGIVASTVDGRTWTWSVLHHAYRWCKLGHLEYWTPKQCARIGYHRELSAAISWTLGYHAALTDARLGRVTVQH